MKEAEKTYDFKKVKQSALKKYESAGIFDVSDLEWLLACCQEKNRTEIAFLKEITKSDLNKIQRALKKRLSGMPVSKIFRSANFYGRDFFVNNNVLSPRSETEILVEEAIKKLKNIPSAHVLDLCSGSGIIGITVKKEMPDCTVACLDVSPRALYVANKNAKKHGVKIKFLKSDMFGALKKNASYDMIISNPPYIKTDDLEKLDGEVKNYDPKISLDGGVSGLDFYEIISARAKQYLKPGGQVLVEVGFNQAEQVKKLLSKNFCNIEVVKDYSSIDRVVLATVKREHHD